MTGKVVYLLSHKSRKFCDVAENIIRINRMNSFTKHNHMGVHLIAALLFAFCAVEISLVILDPSKGYGFTALVLWMGINIIPTFIGIVSSGGTNDSIGIGFYIAVTVQWFIAGGYFSHTAIKLWSKDPVAKP